MVGLTTHDLARELFNHPDNFLTVTIADKEYTVQAVTRTKTHANMDDSMCYWTLICKEDN